jgi:hypothetical protein
VSPSGSGLFVWSIFDILRCTNLGYLVSFPSAVSFPSGEFSRW